MIWLTLWLVASFGFLLGYAVAALLSLSREDELESRSAQAAVSLPRPRNERNAA